MRVLLLTPEWEYEYERFVLAHPHALVYYSLRFRDLLTEVLGCEPRYAIAVDAEGVVGALPLMAWEGRYGLVLNSLPYFGSNGGILAREDAARRALEHWYGTQVADPAVAASTVVANPIELDPLPLVHDLVSERVAHVTWFEAGGTAPPEQQVWDVIDASARRNVKKASRESVEVSIENDSFDELAMLHRESMALVDAPAKNRSFFDAVSSHFRSRSDYDIYVARVRGEPIAALLVFYYGTTVDYYVPALHPTHRSLQPMASILYRAMSDAVERGFQRWNWGGSGLSHEGLMRFKQKWGGQGRPYGYWTKVNSPELLLASPAELVQEYPGFYVFPFSHLAAPSCESSS